MINDQDYRKADLIVTMDDFNFSEVNKLAPDDSFQEKIRPFCDFVTSADREVPDPYYGGDEGFVRVFDMLTEASKGLLAHIVSAHGLVSRRS